MKPFKTALWITKFLASLVLLLGILPASLYVGGAYVWHKHEAHQWAEQAAADAKLQTSAYCQELSGRIFHAPDPIATADGFIPSIHQQKATLQEQSAHDCHTPLDYQGKQ